MMSKCHPQGHLRQKKILLLALTIPHRTAEPYILPKVIAVGADGWAGGADHPRRSTKHHLLGGWPGRSRHGCPAGRGQ